MVALFGGSFDPVHLGHLRIAEDIKEYYNLQKIIFVPSYLSPLKQSHTASAEDRLQMLKLAVSDNPDFEISDYEIRKGGKSYTIQTVEFFKEKLGYNPGFIVGSDAFLSLESWKSPQILLNITNFIVAVRGEESFEKVLQFVEYLNRPIKLDSKIIPHGSGIYIFRERRIDISSTEIRDRIKKGMSIRYLVPEEVEKYIRQTRLYR